MGGAVGHLQHLYDNRDLTFDEIASILSSAAEGKLEKASEKLDGLNLVFSWDVSNDVLKVARSGSDISRGGMDAESLASKFAGRGNLTDAFNSAFKVLNGSLRTLGDKTKTKVFGPAANRWYSVEVIYTKNPNVINYDSNNVVFHGWPVFDAKSGNVEMTEDDAGGVDILTSNVERMQAAVAERGWKIQGPALARMKKLSDDTIVDSTISKIFNELNETGLDGSATMRDYIEVKTRFDVEALGLSPEIVQMVAQRCMGEVGAPTLVDIKKIADKSDHGIIGDFVKSCPIRMKEYVKPIELAINDFAVELLKGLQSTLIDDTEEEIVRLRAEISKAISAIESSGDENAMGILNAQMQKLKSLENITSPVEGVVFIYKGNAYKFTGSFAAANQILGLFKYGRKGKKL
jgi:DNA-binding ferritin-like protein